MPTTRRTAALQRLHMIVSALWIIQHATSAPNCRWSSQSPWSMASWVPGFQQGEFQKLKSYTPIPNLMASTPHLQPRILHAIEP